MCLPSALARAIPAATRSPIIEDSGDLEQQLHAAWRHLFDLYIAACEREDWKDALCMYQWMNELDCLWEDENETPEGFIEGAREWLAKAKKPDELYICY